MAQNKIEKNYKVDIQRGRDFEAWEKSKCEEVHNNIVKTEEYINLRKEGERTGRKGRMDIKLFFSEEKQKTLIIS